MQIALVPKSASVPPPLLLLFNMQQPKTKISVAKVACSSSFLCLQTPLHLLLPFVTFPWPALLVIHPEIPKAFM